MTVPVLYRDHQIIAVAKPSGMAMHRGWATDERTLYDIVRDEIIQSKVFGVHRLDRGTSGVVIFALDPGTAQTLSAQFENGQVRKEYRALVRGPMRDRWFVNHPIRRLDRDGRVDAITEFIPVSTRDRWTLVRAIPLTGRSHQIRLHLKHLSHPIVGDIKHGKGDINRLFAEQYGLRRLALHALRIEFTLNDEKLALSCELPEDLLEPLRRVGLAT